MSDEQIFSEWLFDQMQKHDWNYTIMAKHAGLSRSVIQKIIKRQVKKPDTETCVAIASAFNMSPITVLRLAKHLPPAADIPQMHDLETLMAQLPVERRDEAVDHVRVLLDHEKRRGTV